MKALLIKDIITIWKQMKLMLALILVFSVVSYNYQNVFAVVYAALIPYIALGYDERSKWNRMAAMLPYSARDIVRSKYVLGFLFCTATLILALAIRFAVSAVRSEAFDGLLLVLGFIGAMLIMDISLPLMFRFGVEKGRVIMAFIVFLICGGTAAVVSIPQMPNTNIFLTVLSAFAVTIVLTALSVRLSSKLYLKHES